MRVPECMSMLLFLLCAGTRAVGASAPRPTLFNGASAFRLKPWAMGDSSGMALAAVSPVRGAFAAAMLVGGASGCATPARACAGELGMGTSVALIRPGAALASNGCADSPSAAVVVERLLADDDDGKVGTEKVLDTAEATESCEPSMSCVGCVAMFGPCAVSAASGGPIGKLADSG